MNYSPNNPLDGFTKFEHDKPEFLEVSYRLNAALQRFDISVLQIRDVSKPQLQAGFHRRTNGKQTLDCWVDVSRDSTTDLDLKTILHSNFTDIQRRRFGVGALSLNGKKMKQGKNIYRILLCDLYVGRSYSKNSTDEPNQYQMHDWSNLEEFDSIMYDADKYQKYDRSKPDMDWIMTAEGRYVSNQLYYREYGIKNTNQILPRFYIEFEYDPMATEKKVVPNCDLCYEAGRVREATVYCKVCQANFCDSCDLEFHDKPFLRNHARVPTSQRDAFGTCPDHPNQLISFFCTTCRKPVCIECKMFGSHANLNDHKLIKISQFYKNGGYSGNRDGLKETSDEITSFMKGLKEKERDVELQYSKAVSKLQEMFAREMNRLNGKKDEKINILNSDMANCIGMLDHIAYSEEFLEYAKENKNPVEFLKIIEDHDKYSEKLLDLVEGLPENNLNIEEGFVNVGFMNGITMPSMGMGMTTTTPFQNPLGMQQGVVMNEDTYGTATSIVKDNMKSMLLQMGYNSISNNIPGTNAMNVGNTMNTGNNAMNMSMPMGNTFSNMERTATFNLNDTQRMEMDNTVQPTTDADMYADADDVSSKGTSDEEVDMYEDKTDDLSAQLPESGVFGRVREVERSPLRSAHANKKKSDDIFADSLRMYHEEEEEEAIEIEMTQNSKLNPLESQTIASIYTPSPAKNKESMKTVVEQPLSSSFKRSTHELTENSVILPSNQSIGQPMGQPMGQPLRQPVMNQPIISQPVMNQPVVNQPIMNQPVMNQPIMNHQPIGNLLHKYVTSDLVSSKVSTMHVVRMADVARIVEEDFLKKNYSIPQGFVESNIVNDSNTAKILLLNAVRNIPVTPMMIYNSQTEERTVEAIQNKIQTNKAGHCLLLIKKNEEVFGGYCYRGFKPNSSVLISRSYVFSLTKGVRLNPIESYGNGLYSTMNDLIWGNQTNQDLWIHDNLMVKANVGNFFGHKDLLNKGVLCKEIEFEADIVELWVIPRH
eukprot:TRINITY_DN2318_c0_g1_i1.p1 TRINITY_DN2318_c0_g1~~TRINITY_DN2318_c0_g1_i1.p1  ORF type:complete len:991 (+),score=276.67 TRINITY_DN2318_c0_g1_i1:33-3005(+)